MADLKIVKITSEISLNSFNSGNCSIDNLIAESYYPTILQHAYTFEVSKREEDSEKEKVLCYYMLRFSSMDLDSCPESISEYRSSIIDNCSCIHLEYIATTFEYQNYGIGTTVIKYIIKTILDFCNNWPIRLITLYAIKEKYNWYRKLGFVAFNESDLNDSSPTINMYMDCLLEPEKVNNYTNYI